MNFCGTNKVIPLVGNREEQVQPRLALLGVAVVGGGGKVLYWWRRWLLLLLSLPTEVVRVHYVRTSLRISGKRLMAAT